MSAMEIKPVPLTVGARVKRTARGKSARLFTFETKTKGEMRSTTEFAFAVETTVRALKDGTVSEVSFRIDRAARETEDDVLTPDAWIPAGRPLTERPLGLDGLSATARRSGATVAFFPEGAVRAEDRYVVEKLVGSLLGQAESELGVVAMTLQVGQQAPELAEPIRRLLSSEVGWARVPTDSFRSETEPSSVTVESIDPGGPTATVQFALGRDLPDDTLGTALSLTGHLRIQADGRPVQLTASGTAAHAFRTMAGFERARGSVSIEIVWE